MYATSSQRVRRLCLPLPQKRSLLRQSRLLPRSGLSRKMEYYPMAKLNQTTRQLQASSTMEVLQRPYAKPAPPVRLPHAPLPYSRPRRLKPPPRYLYNLPEIPSDRCRPLRPLMNVAFCLICSWPSPEYLWNPRMMIYPIHLLRLPSSLRTAPPPTLTWRVCWLNSSSAVIPVRTFPLSSKATQARLALLTPQCYWTNPLNPTRPFRHALKKIPLEIDGLITVISCCSLSYCNISLPRSHPTCISRTPFDHHQSSILGRNLFRLSPSLNAFHFL
jgi:hypothetical protein